MKTFLRYGYISLVIALMALCLINPLVLAFAIFMHLACGLIAAELLFPRMFRNGDNWTDAMIAIPFCILGYLALWLALDMKFNKEAYAKP